MMRGALVFAALLAACGGGGGNATVCVVTENACSTSAALANRTLTVQSAFAWVDAVQGYERGPDGNWVVKLRERKLLQLRLLGATLDPRQDLRQRPVAELIQIAQDLAQNGFVSVNVLDFAKVGINTPLKAGEVVSDTVLFLVDEFQFGARPVAGDYPQTVSSLGSDRDFIITFTRIEDTVGGVIEGTLEVEFKRKQSDPTDAVQGKMKIQFSALLVSERIAECNDETSYGTNLSRYDEVPECQDP
jgi:hypothetical protein